MKGEMEFDRIAFDTKLMRPGCTLIQAALGCEKVALAFDSRTWLTHPTPDMHVYPLEPGQLEKLVAMTERAMCIAAEGG